MKIACNTWTQAFEISKIGLFVFPCLAGEKRPATTRGFHDATTDEAQIARWCEQHPTANLAVSTKGLVVIDIDGEENPWLSDQPELKKALSEVPTVRTPRGGRHHYFRAGDRRFRCSGSKLAPNVDVRADGGYVVVPPSRTEQGEYVWLTPLPATLEEIPVVPAWLEQLLIDAKGTPARTAQSESKKLIRSGSRNIELTSLGGRLRRRGHDEAGILAELSRVNTERCKPPLEEEEVRRIAQSVARYPTSLSRNARPEIMVTTEEHEVNDAIVEALARDPELFQRAGKLVRLTGRTGHASEGLTIAEMSAGSLREIITRNAVLLRTDKDGEPVECHPPAWATQAVLERGRWPAVRPLNGIAYTPVLRSDGTVAGEDGYDPATGVFVQLSGDYPPVPSAPTRDDALAAVGELCDVFADFPFETDVHRSACLTAILTLVSWHAFDGPAPLFLVDANIRAAGKTLLTQVVALITQGSIVPTTSYTNNTEELRKQLTATALDGTPMVIFDNIAGIMGNDALDRALTASRWRDRRLGGNETVEAPFNTVFFATGNNTTLQADTARRVVHIRLNSPQEHPEDRSGFRHPDLLAHVKQHRARLFAAALKILAAYIRAGRPSQNLRPMGSFEAWSALPRSATVWAGLPDPCLGRDGLEAVADSQIEELAELHAAFREYDPAGRGVVIADVLHELERDDASPAALKMKHAFELLVGHGEISGRVVAAQLKKHRGRVIKHQALVQIGDRGKHGVRWAVRSVGLPREPVIQVTQVIHFPPDSESARVADHAKRESPESPESPSHTETAASATRSTAWK